ncbi:MAG TPA: N-acylglucosamine 2-epimerase [Lachnospiraceae bacterium]|nr:N-acylglucosamine 2-epimerase [Lachnospiraceae bacterium]
MIADEVKKEFTEHVIPFWENLRDDEYGGYYGYLDFELNLDKKAVKGCILNSRILWFFANAYMVFKKEEYLDHARHAYEFMKRACFDDECGGVYWSVTYDGKPDDTTKHTYNQAFAIYALSSYYAVSSDKEALDRAYMLYHVIEEKCRDEGGYLEAFTREFKPESNEKLSENGVEATRTMNTLLHVFEAYTELYRVSGAKDESGKTVLNEADEVADKLKEMLDIFAEKMYNPEKHRQEVFFDHEYNSLIDLYSYGHDIETAWLIDRGLEVLEENDAADWERYAGLLHPITEDLTAEVYKEAFTENGMPAECCEGVVDQSRVWWVQAETVVGFYNGYQRTAKKEYLEAVKTEWDFIKNNLIDKREGSEWFYEVTPEGEPESRKPIVEPWKCPYHTGRMCFELIRRQS